MGGDLTSLFTIVVTRSPLAGRSELVHGSTSHAAYLADVRLANGYIGVYGWWLNFFDV